MKKIAVLLALLALILGGCAATEVGYLDKLYYSNLVDDSSQEWVENALLQAGISNIAVDEFFRDVNEFNAVAADEYFVKEGFKDSENLDIAYDAAQMQMKLEQANPEFLGNNCRITTFGLMQDILKVDSPEFLESMNLFLDYDSLRYQERLDENALACFDTIFRQVSTKNTTDIQYHLEQVKKDWKERGVKFNRDVKATLISVFFHDTLEEENNTLFAGHVGVLVPTKDSKLLFIEKLSFQEPYQAIVFDNREHLSDYLMHKYDTQWGQDAAVPFIMENDELMKGYRPNPNKKQQ